MIFFFLSTGVLQSPRLRFWQTRRRFGPVLHAIAFAAILSSHAETIRFDFNQTNSIAPVQGKASLRVIGTTNYQFSSGKDSSDPQKIGNLALTLAGFPAQGKSPRSTGLECTFSTLKQIPTHVSFDLRPSNTSSRRVLGLVSTNGQDFSQVGAFDLLVGGVFTNRITFDLQPYPGLADQPEMTLRLVSDFSSEGQYVGVNGRYSAAGTWRWDQLIIESRSVDADPDPQIPTPPISAYFSVSPSNQTLGIGQALRLRSETTGLQAPVHFQWFFETAALTNATKSTYTVARTGAKHAGDYWVVASDTRSSITSHIATIRVVAPPTIQFVPTLSSTSNRMPLSLDNEFTMSRDQTVQLEIQVSDPEGQLCRVRPTGTEDGLAANWSLVADHCTNVVGVLEVRGQDLVPGIPREIELEAGNDWATNRIRWIFYCPTDLESSLVLTEILSAPSTRTNSALFNPLRRNLGTNRLSSSLDEFIELQNEGNQPLALENWIISDASQVRHRFGPIALQPRDLIVVYGGDALEITNEVNQSLAPNIPGKTEVASTKRGLALGNLSDTITLRNASSNLIWSIRYQFTNSIGDSSLAWADGQWMRHLEKFGSPLSPGTHLEPLQSPKLELLRSPQSPGLLELHFQESTAHYVQVWQASEPGGPWNPFGSAINRSPVMITPNAGAKYFKIESSGPPTGGPMP